MQKGKKPFLYLVWTIRFIQGSLIFGIVYSLATIISNTMLGLTGVIVFSLLFISSFYIAGKLKDEKIKDTNTRLLKMGKVRKEMFVRSPLPMVNMNMQGDIWWYNESFKKAINKEDILDANIHSILPEMQIEELPKDDSIMKKEVSIGEKFYTIYCELVKVDIDKKNEYHYVMYFDNKTELIHLKRQFKNVRSIVAIMCIDNYTEILQDVDEVKRPMLTAIIDRRVHKWMEDEDLIIRKFERDKYMVVFPFQLLKTMEETKFSILDEMRRIKLGNQLPITMSIGVGKNVNSLTQSMEESRAALDLALGRGGDQVVIKNQDKYTFYGGTTKEVEKSTRVKARMKAYAFKELIQESDNIVVMGHKNMDMDCLGAAMGVYRATAMLGKKAQIVLNGPTTSIQTLYDRIIQEDEYDDLFITSSEAESIIDDQTLLVIVDVHRASYVEYPKLLDIAEKVVVFDHHRRSADYIDDAVLTYYESYISSTCEMIAEVLQYMGDKVKLTNIEADALLAGITVDTKNFVFKTGVRTFEAAAFLRRNGADSTRVRMLFQSDLSSYRAKAEALKDSEIYNETMAIAIVESDIDNGAIIAAQTADELLNIKGIKASYALTGISDIVSISARSHGDINVQVIMEKLGGGGHQTVAGAQIESQDIDTVKEILKNTIDEYFEGRK